MKRDDLLYDLIFSEKEEFEIDISNYIENIYIIITIKKYQK